jgi:type I restriction enzyme R subunit
MVLPVDPLLPVLLYQVNYVQTLACLPRASIRLGPVTQKAQRLGCSLVDGCGERDPGRKAKEIEIKVAKRLRGLLGNPKFKALSERLEDLKNRHEQGLLHSVEFLKKLLEIAREVLQAEKETPVTTVAPEDDGKNALTELFQDVKNEQTPIVVERIVDDIDGIVRQVRFPGWQKTSAGEREVKRALRSTLFKYQLHADKDLFEKAYGYIREYY